jgi:hypothetical protein
MRFCAFLGTTLVLGLPAVPDVHGQDMTEDVALLHRVVFERDGREPLRDPAPARELGLRYLEGRGVDRNGLMACAMFFLARQAVQFYGRDQATLDPGEPLFDQHCAGRYRGPEEFESLVQAACGTFGLEPQVFEIEPGAWVEISLAGIAIDRPLGRTRHSLFNPCSHQFVVTRHVAVSSAAGPVPVRHFLEFVAWVSVQDGDGWRRDLEWLVLEVIDSRLEEVALEVLVREPGSVWPSPPVPAPYRNGASFTMTPAGEVQWGFDTAPPSSGLVERRHD